MLDGVFVCFLLCVVFVCLCVLSMCALFVMCCVMLYGASFFVFKVCVFVYLCSKLVCFVCDFCAMLYDLFSVMFVPVDECVRAFWVNVCVVFAIYCVMLYGLCLCFCL